MESITDLSEGFLEKIKVLKDDFYRNEGFQGSPWEPESINSTVNGQDHSYYS